MTDQPTVGIADPAEVERVAALLHDAFCRHAIAKEGPAVGPQLRKYDDLSDAAKERYRACARAVVADRRRGTPE